MKRIICVFIGIVFSVITTAIFFYCLMFSVRALIGGVGIKESDLWIFYAIVFPAALVFAFVANYLYDKPILTEKKLWTVTFVAVFCISLLTGGVGLLASDLYTIGHIPHMYNYSGRIGWGLAYSFGLIPFSIVFSLMTIKALLMVIKSIQTKEI